jgi:hypothetical protein
VRRLLALSALAFAAVLGGAAPAAPRTDPTVASRAAVREFTFSASRLGPTT